MVEVDEKELNKMQNYMQQLEGDLQDQQTQHGQFARGQMSMFGSGGAGEDNLIRWQLDLKEDLDRIYHLLKGHQLKEDDDGNVIYAEPTDNALVPFNEFGVGLIMNIMTFYLNRNTILSNYDEKTINWKILDFGHELSDLIFNRYEEMGMDTPEKIKMFPMVVRELVDTIHSAYLRAYHGGERESLRTARTVTQNQPIGDNYQNQNSMQTQRKSRWYNPLTWGK